MTPSRCLFFVTRRHPLLNGALPLEWGVNRKMRPIWQDLRRFQSRVTLVYRRVYRQGEKAMLMTPVQIKVTNITPQGERLLDAIRRADGWISRGTLARQMKKTRLNQWDTAMLDYLCESGRIESRQAERPGPIGYEWQYRIRKDE